MDGYTPIAMVQCTIVITLTIVEAGKTAEANALGTSWRKRTLRVKSSMLPCYMLSLSCCLSEEATQGQREVAWLDSAQDAAVG